MQPSFSLSANVSLGQRQEQQMTTAQMQSLKLLGCNQMDLRQEVQNVLSQNPFLEMLQSPMYIDEADYVPENRYEQTANEKEWDSDNHEYNEAVLTSAIEHLDDNDYSDKKSRNDSGDASDSGDRSDDAHEYADDNAAGDSSSEHDFNADYENDADYESDASRNDPKYERMMMDCRNPDAEEKRQYLFDSYAGHESLYEKLVKQLDDAQCAEPRFYKLCCNICGEVNENGFIEESDQELAQSFNASIEDVRKAIACIQELSPAGIGARNLRECYLLQLKDKHLVGSLEWDIADRYLDDLAQQRNPEIVAKEIAKKIDADVDETKDAIERLRHLDATPGLTLCPRTPLYVTPDVFIKCDKKGNFFAAINEDSVPQLEYNQDYLAMRKDPSNDKATKEWLNAKYNQATQLTYGLENRQKTIVEATNAIIAAQLPYLKSRSKSDMQPLTLKQIGEKIDKAESTVSRAVQNKYAKLPWGNVIPLNDFFVRGFTNTSGNGEAVSDAKIRERIKELIANENKFKPLSDQEISDTLKKEGYKVERRTVVKKREQEGIPSSSKRREK